MRKRVNLFSRLDEVDGSSEGSPGYNSTEGVVISDVNVGNTMEQAAFKFTVEPNQACYFNVISTVSSTAGTKGAFQLNEQKGNLGLMLIEGEWNVTTT